MPDHVEEEFRSYLVHIGEPTSPPLLHPARGPPQTELVMGTGGGWNKKRSRRNPSPTPSIRLHSSIPPSRSPCLKTTPIRAGTPSLHLAPALPEARPESHPPPPPHPNFHPTWPSWPHPFVSSTFPQQTHGLVGPFFCLSLVRLPPLVVIPGSPRSSLPLSVQLIPPVTKPPSLLRRQNTFNGAPNAIHAVVEMASDI